MVGSRPNGPFKIFPIFVKLEKKSGLKLSSKVKEGSFLIILSLSFSRNIGDQSAGSFFTPSTKKMGNLVKLIQFQLMFALIRNLYLRIY